AGLELVAEVDQPVGAVDERHPDLGADVERRGRVLGVADPGRLDAAPDGLAAPGPLAEAVDAPGDVPEVAGDLLAVVAGGVDVERGDVAAFEVLRVVLGVVRADPAAVP